MGDVIEWIRQQSAWTHSALSYGALAYSIFLIPIVSILVGGSLPNWKQRDSAARVRERVAILVALVMAVPTWVAGPVFFYCTLVYRNPSYLYTGVPISALASAVWCGMLLRKELRRTREAAREK